MTRESFLADVANHRMQVLRDDGLYRHLRFAHRTSLIFSFHIITWPGTLCIEGDMGTWVFHDYGDMLSLFRRQTGSVNIDIVYWTEKLSAEGVFQAAKEGSHYAAQYEWCLWAIVWGIDQYDCWKDAQPWQS